jgi:ferredoxin-NADP reductase
VADRDGDRDPPRDAEREVLSPRAADVDGAPARPALRRAPHRARRLSRAALVLGGVVDRLADGEVSPYFHDVVRVGDEIEIRGPFASYFVWRGSEPGPVLLVGGGSGVVPLMAMLRHRRRALPHVPMRLVYSVREVADVIYADELAADPDVLLTYTRGAPEGWSGHTGRIDAQLLGGAAAGAMTAYVCGSNGFVERATALLLEAGLAAEWIRTERFGPTG